MRSMPRCRARCPPTRSGRGTIRAGDVLLYGNDTLVAFYETFSSAYSYTRLGRVENGAELARALGAGSARVAFSIQ